MKVILCKPNTKPEVVELPKKHNYKDIKRLLEIDSPLTCVSRKITENGQYYDFWCDDEGLFPEKKYMSAMCKNGCELLCGNVLIAKHDNEGNLIGLKKEEIEEILKEEHWVENEDFIKFQGRWARCKLDEDNNQIAFENYAGFGRVLLHRKGQMLRYFI